MLNLFSLKNKEGAEGGAGNSGAGAGANKKRQVRCGKTAVA